MDAEEGERLLAMDPRHAEVINPLLSGKDIAQRHRVRYIIDFALRTEAEARTYPVLYEIVLQRVKPERDANKRESRRRTWWLFGEPGQALRSALSSVQGERVIATSEAAEHRLFRWAPKATVLDAGITVVVSDVAWLLGSMNSNIHLTWAERTGPRLGVVARYKGTLCFDPFPFPVPPRTDIDSALALGDIDQSLHSALSRVGDLANAIEAHRDDVLRRTTKLTLTQVYNVLRAVRTGRDLTPEEREISVVGAVSTLKALHDDLDVATEEAYGWRPAGLSLAERPLLGEEEIIARLAELNRSRSDPPKV